MHVATATTAIDPSRPDVQRRPRSGRWFFVGMAVAAAVTVFVGFARTYYLKSLFPMPPLSWLFNIHAAVFTAWMLLLVLQAAVIAARRIALHGRLGVLGG